MAKSFTTTPSGGKGPQPRSFRVEDDTWEQVRRRSQKEGITPSGAMQLLAEGYARGMYVLPSVELVWPDGTTTTTTN